MATMLSIENLGRSFGDRKVFSGINLKLEAPAALGVTGKNGSGKSTLMKIIAGLLLPSQGKIEIEDSGKVVKSEELLNHLKMVSPEMALYEMLTGYENLRFFSTLVGSPLPHQEMDELLKEVGLEGRGSDLVIGYSSGMKQRLKYAVALLAKPDILLLDEPTSNLDSAGKEIVAEIIRKQKADKIVIIATNESEDLAHADRIIKLGS